MENVKIRNYRNGDYPEIEAFWKPLGLGGSQRGDDAHVVERTLKNEGAFFLMHHNEKLIGTAWITNDLRRLYLHHMGIHIAYQNRGLGMQLLKHCLKWAKKTGLQIKLEVLPTNKSAVHLYAKAGFKRLGDYDVHIIRDYNELPETD